MSQSGALLASIPLVEFMCAACDIKWKTLNFTIPLPAVAKTNTSEHGVQCANRPHVIVHEMDRMLIYVTNSSVLVALLGAGFGWYTWWLVKCC